MRAIAIVLFLSFFLGCLTINIPVEQRPDKNVAAPSAGGCVVCNAIFTAYFDYVNTNNQSETDFNAFFDKVCSYLPESYLTKCDEIAQDIANELVVMVPTLSFMDYSPYVLCSMFDYCTVECCVSLAPEQVHLSLTGNPSNEMAVTWITQTDSPSQVYYGTSPQNLSSLTEGWSYTYTSGGWLGFLHTAVLKNLSPDTVYYYQVGSKTTGFSQIFHFSTYKSSASKHSFAVVGDMGTGTPSDNTINRLIELTNNGQLDGVIHDGDISYADGSQTRWDLYGRKVQPFTSLIPYMVAPGNHEIAFVWILGLHGYENRFFMPGNDSGSNTNLYYSWNYGATHYIAVNSESNLDTPEISPEQLEWLKNDLSEANQHRSERPWIVVYMHRPLYCSKKNSLICDQNALTLREVLEDLFYEQQVDVVITAHIHTYERTWPVYQSRASQSYENAKFPTYIVNGVGGNREGWVKSSSDRPDWSAAVAGDTWGYGVLSTNMTHLEWDFYNSNDNQILDQFVATKY